MKAGRRVVWRGGEVGPAVLGGRQLSGCGRAGGPSGRRHTSLEALLLNILFECAAGFSPSPCRGPGRRRTMPLLAAAQAPTLRT